MLFVFENLNTLASLGMVWSGNWMGLGVLMLESQGQASCWRLLGKLKQWNLWEQRASALQPEAGSTEADSSEQSEALANCPLPEFDDSAELSPAGPWMN
jgi:hypothetical protein